MTGNIQRESYVPFLAYYNSTNISQTGYIVIELEEYLSQMNTYDINIYNYTNDISSRIVLWFYYFNYKSFHGITYDTLGYRYDLTLAILKDTQKPCILIGSNTSEWVYPNVTISAISGFNTDNEFYKKEVKIYITDDIAPFDIKINL